MKSITLIPLLLIAISSHVAHAGAITNGGFSSCDYSGWNKDTDGLGDISNGNDFTIDNNGSTCRAALSADYFDQAGDPFSTAVSDAWFANTLSQELDFTGNSTSSWALTIDFEVDSEETSLSPLFTPDMFAFWLNDGTGDVYDENGILDELLVERTLIDGSFQDSLTFELDSSFTNTTGWSLDLQLAIGLDQFGMPDGFGSTLYINEVSLTEVLTTATDVSEPATLAIFGLGFLGLVNRRKHCHKNNK